MELRNEFAVAAPPERAWAALLDIERMAGFLPGASVEPGGEDGVLEGSMSVKLGPIAMTYRGTARLAAVDEQARTADIAVEAREARGRGGASAVIRNTIVPDAAGTRVIAETDLRVTGRQAQFGRGIVQDVASKMLDEFARRFERSLLDEHGGAPQADGPAPALELGSVLSGTALARRAAAASAVLALLLAAAALRRRRRSGRLRLTLSW